MSVLDILYTVLIMPLQLGFEVLYMLADSIIGNPGASIVALSLMMNFLVLPLYMRADKMQEDERVMEAKLHDGVAHIRKTFKGDEKMMMLNTYYRQNDYRPTDVFKGSISLFLEIPFFISAYIFLSTLEALQGVPFGPISDLGAPDGLISVGGFSINLLPFIMTGINLISCVIFTKGMPRKTKIQLYGMAAFFLVFLYTSPAGLVFYWTLNNLFSLIKTIFYKLKNPGKVLRVLFFAVGVVLIVFGLGFYADPSVKKKLVIVALGVVCVAPAVVSLVRAKAPARKTEKKPLPHNKKVYVLGAVLLTVLTGLLIPSAVIASSPQEFIDVTYYLDPIWYIVSSFCLAFGAFMIWMSVFYWLTSESRKGYFDVVVWAACVIAVLNYMAFGTNLGTLSASLVYLGGMDFTSTEVLVNLGAVVIAAVVAALLYRHTKRLVPTVLGLASVAFIVMGGVNIQAIVEQVEQAQPAIQQTKDSRASFTLSKSGKNVVVLMLDRGMNEYVPYIMNEKPELQEAFDGFTYYDNVTSFGAFTNFGVPSLFGGYEYTPVEMNKRSNELLVDKHDEALKVMPVLFDQQGYDVTVCDPTYAGYQWKPDLSIYDGYPDIKTYITLGTFSDADSSKYVQRSNKRNFFCFAITKTSPLFVQTVFYNNGNYNQSAKAVNKIDAQAISENGHKAEGLSKSFMDPYQVLQHLGDMTNITEDDKGTFLMMTNDTTHEPAILSEPDYQPSASIDNTEYDVEHADRFTLNGVTLKMENGEQYAHYETNVAALQEVAKWLQLLKDEGVYDNTRIIICADHGRHLHHLDSREIGDGSSAFTDTELYYPILLVKDFDAHGFTTDSQFMTDADVPTIATTDLIANPVNPFTGKPIINTEKYAHDQYVLGSVDWDVNVNNGTQYLPGTWFAVHDDVRDKNNWAIVDEPTQ